MTASPTLSIGNGATGRDGSTIFTINTLAGQVLVRTHDGQVDILGDTASRRLTGSGNQPLTSYDTGGSSPYAVNSTGQFLALANAANGGHLWRFDIANNDIEDIFRVGSASPAGPNFNNVTRAALDPGGHAAFISNLSDGSVGLFLWDGSRSRRFCGRD